MQKYFDESLINRTNAIIEIMKINSPEKSLGLKKSLMNSGPELYALKLTEWINRNIQINLQDAESLVIYSLLTNRTIDDINMQIQSTNKQNVARKR